jgi:hypothetical protein
MTHPLHMRMLRLASVLALLALGLMAWSLFDPRAFPVIVAMSVGQLLGTASFAAFGWVVLGDVRAKWKVAQAARRSRTSAPPSDGSAGSIR